MVIGNIPAEVAVHTLYIRTYACMVVAILVHTAYRTGE